MVRDGRIGYWYTNSRFRPRGEAPQRRSKGFTVFHFSDVTRPWGREVGSAEWEAPERTLWADSLRPP